MRFHSLILTAMFLGTPLVLHAQPCLQLVPELDAVLPAEGEVATTVTLEGFGFQFGACLVSVTFGGEPSPSVQFIDAFTLSVVVPDVAPGSRPVRVTTVGGASGQIPFTVLSDEAPFSRGDCNQDGTLNIADAISTLERLFAPGGLEPACRDACDANDDEGFDISDAIFTLGLLFASGPAPSAPYPNCGSDPSGDGLDCLEYAGCP